MKRILWSSALFPALLFIASCGSSSPSPVITVDPTGATLNVNTTQQFTATIVNLSSTLVNWQVNGTVGGSATYGTITTGGLYTAPAAVPSGSLNVVTVTAVAQAQSSLTAASNVTILPAAAIALSCPNCPTPITVSAGNSLSFLASVGTTAQNSQVNWSVNGIANGNIATVGAISGGLYTAPLVPPSGGSVTVTATEQNDTTQSASLPVNVTLGTATMQGSYTFSVSGNGLAGPFARAGYFNIGTNGTITGLESLNLPGLAPATVQFSGLYFVGSDGRGVMQFCEFINGNNCTLSQVSAAFRLVVVSTQQIQLIPFEAGNVGAGEANSQGTLQFGSTDLAGCYTFDFSGKSTFTTLESALGYFCASGSGSITSGEMDVNVGGVVTLYQLNPSTYTLHSNNQGTLTLLPAGGTPLNLAFFMVSTGRAKFVETDALPVLSGDAITQSTPGLWSNASLNAPVVFELLGMGSSGGIAQLGRFIPDGNGNIIAGSTIDQDYMGGVNSIGATGTYAIDARGRGTITLTNGATYIFYLKAPNSATLQEYATGLVAHGPLVQQSGTPFTAANISGSYGLSQNGFSVAGPVFESIVGQLSANGNGVFTSGTIDVNQPGVRSPGEPVTAGTFAIFVPAGRGNMILNPSTDNRNYLIYMVSPTQAFIMGSDAQHVTVGSLTKQF